MFGTMLSYSQRENKIKYMSQVTKAHEFRFHIPIVNITQRRFRGDDIIEQYLSKHIV